jgi:hypothetical protein
MPVNKNAAHKTFGSNTSYYCTPTRFFSLVHENMTLVVLRLPGVYILASCRLVHEEAKGFLTAKLDTILARTPKLIASAHAAMCCLHREGAPNPLLAPVLRQTWTVRTFDACQE